MQDNTQDRSAAQTLSLGGCRKDQLLKLQQMLQPPIPNGIC